MAVWLSLGGIFACCNVPWQDFYDKKVDLNKVVHSVYLLRLEKTLCAREEKPSSRNIRPYIIFSIFPLAYGETK